MGASKRIKQLMIEKDVNVKSLSEKLEIVNSPQALSNKLYKDNFSFSDVEKIASVLGCDVKLVDRETGKEFQKNITYLIGEPSNMGGFIFGIVFVIVFSSRILNCFVLLKQL